MSTNTEIRFYHLQRQTMAQALPALLEKALQKNVPICVRTNGADSIEQLHQTLWQDPNRFIPHGSTSDGHAQQQPIWLTETNDNPNGAKILILVNDVWPENLDEIKNYDMVCTLFNGTDENAVAQSRTHWKQAKEQNFTLSYWQQDERGGWTLKS